MEKKQAIERKLQFRAMLPKLDTRDLLYLRATMLYKRVSSPSARFWIKGFMLAFVLASKRVGG